MKPRLWILFGILAICFQARAQTEGRVTFQNAVAPSVGSPAIRCPSDLSQNPIPLGTNWTAELWWGPEAIDESQMQPVARALFHESRAGYFRGNSSVVLPGSVGGQVVALQIRVWFNAGNTITNWDQAIQTMSWPQHTKIIRDYVLFGIDSNNVPVLGSGNMGNLGLTWQCVVSPPLTDSDFDGLSDAYERGIGRFRVVSTPRMSWHQARDDARNRGGRLASVPTLARWNIIKESTGSSLHGKNLWLGGTDEAVEGQWQWLSGEPWGFTNWRINEPNNDSLGNGRGLPEHHLMIWGRETAALDGQQAFWNDVPVDGGTLAQDGYVLEIGHDTDPFDPDSDDDGLSDGEEVLGLRRYQIVARSLPWLEAARDAVERGGHLATLTSAIEAGRAFSEIQGGFRNEEIWLGATNAGPSSGGWRWITGEPFTSTMWAASHPLVDAQYIALRLPANDLVSAVAPGDLRSYLLEVFARSNPLNADTDGDGLKDGDEWRFFLTRPDLADTDGDALVDSEEIRVTRTDPLQSDSDKDGLSDGDEIRSHRTNPLRIDTDGDGFGDGLEVALGSDPRLASSLPGARMRAGKALEIEFEAKAGKLYQIQYQDATGVWRNHGNRITGTGGIHRELISTKLIGNRPWRAVLWIQ